MVRRLIRWADPFVSVGGRIEAQVMRTTAEGETV